MTTTQSKAIWYIGMSHSLSYGNTMHGKNMCHAKEHAYSPTTKIQTIDVNYMIQQPWENYPYVLS